MELSKVRERLAERGLKLVLTDEAKNFLIKKGSNLDFGARPLRRAIENFVEDPLSEELLKGEFQGMDTITFNVKEVADKKQFVFQGSLGAPPPLRLKNTRFGRFPAATARTPPADRGQMSTGCRKIALRRHGEEQTVDRGKNLFPCIALCPPCLRGESFLSHDRLPARNAERRWSC